MVEFFYQAGDDPFVCGVTGHVTTDALFKIEAEAKQEFESLPTKATEAICLRRCGFPGNTENTGR